MKTWLSIIALASCLLVSTSEARGAPPVADLLHELVEAELPAGWGVVDLRPPARLRVSSDSSLALELSGPIRAGKTSAVLLVSRGDRIVARHVFSVDLAPLRSVLVARRPLEKGETVRPGDLELVERPVLDGIELPAEIFTGVRVLRPLAAREVVARGALAQPPPVAGGTTVRVVVAVGSVEIATSGVLTRPTRLGDLALVRTERKVLRGRLVGPTLFVVEGDR